MKPDPIAIWLAAIERDPKQAVADLLSGRLDRGQFARLECAEFMQRALADAADTQRERLDEGLSAWLAEALEQDEVWRRRDGLSAHLYRLNEAFAAIYLLDLPRTAAQLREHHPDYLRWLRSYDYGYGDGPYAGYWRALVSTQKKGTAALFRRQWHDFVVYAGEARYPDYLFQIGMAGLRQLPIKGEERQMATITALLNRAWRRDTDSSLADFAERLSALRAEYPMANDTWRGRVLRALQLLEENAEAQRSRLPLRWQKQDADLLEAFKANLGRALKPLIGDLNLGRAPAQAISLPPLPHCDELDRLKQALRQHRTSAVKGSLGLFERHRRYAEISGDAYFFVRTLCNLGHLILKQPNLEHTTLEALRALLRHALFWEPSHAYSWNFWAELEQAEGREDVAETVLWEAVRRFPDEKTSRVELALLLQRRFEREPNPTLLVEAEQLLREAADADPDNAPSRVELALLLQRRSKRESNPDLLAEAEHILQEVVQRFPKNEYGRNELARLLARNGRGDEAKTLLQEGLAIRQNSYWANTLASIEEGRPLPLLPPKPVKKLRVWKPATSTQMSESLKINAAAARYALARERGETPDPFELQKAASHYPLPRFYLAWFGEQPLALEQDVRPPYALAALAALEAKQDEQRWKKVEGNYPAQFHDTALLRLYAGVPVSEKTRNDLAQWLKEDEDAKDAVPVADLGVTHDDSPRDRLRKMDLLQASEKAPGGLASSSRNNKFDRLMERMLASTIEADVPVAMT